jgi:hypothetical protein
VLLVNKKPGLLQTGLVIFALSLIYSLGIQAPVASAKKVEVIKTRRMQNFSS